MNNLINLAFEAGWLLAAKWAGRDDLQHDTGSPAYTRDRDNRLAGLLQGQPVPVDFEPLYLQAMEQLRSAVEERNKLAAEVAALRRDGPIIERGTDGDGHPIMGTMRSVLTDYMLAAQAEARLADELQAGQIKG